MVTTISEFLLWTFILYWMHRLVHVVGTLKVFHMDHHKVVNKGGTGWHWSNLFLFNDTWKSTLDLWITEVVPTLLLCWSLDAWWMAVFYYVWAALIQESVEHNQDFDIVCFTSGRWHMEHHRRSRHNYGVFIPLWDITFGTYVETPYTH